MTQKIWTVEASDDGQRLDRWLQNKFPNVPYPLVQKALRIGDIRVDGKKADGKARLTAAQQVRLPPAFYHSTLPGGGERPLTDDEKKMAKYMVIYDDEHMMVLNKPSGLATQGGTKTTRHVDRLLMAFAKPDGDKPKLVHRLDKDTSGILLVAKSRMVAERLGMMFKERTITKTYLAITNDVPRTHEGTIKLALLKTETPDGAQVVVDRENGKLAVTHYKTLSYRERRVALLALQPETGRMHQLRVHLKHILCPILGDTKYGGVSTQPMLAEAAQERLWLHAFSVQLDHPVTRKELQFFAPVPPEMRKWIDAFDLGIPMVTDTLKPTDPFAHDV